MENENVRIVRVKEKSKSKYGRLLLAGVLVLLLAAGVILGVSGYVGWNLTHPQRQALDTTPLSVGLSYQEVVFPSQEDGLELKGWFIPSAGSHRTVIFAHGYRKNRLNSDVPILPIARYLVEKGYNVLMFDFRNSGESGGTLTSVGQYEVRDLLGAVEFVRSHRGIQEEIILYGFSMGASTAILAGAREPAVAAVIADSPFADLKSYLRSNLSVWTELPSFPFNAAFFLIVPRLTGLKPEAVSPLREVQSLSGRPLLLIAGDADTDVPMENSMLLQSSYPQAQLLLIPGGKHVKNYQTQPEQYLKTVGAFLEQVQPVSFYQQPLTSPHLEIG